MACGFTSLSRGVFRREVTVRGKKASATFPKTYQLDENTAFNTGDVRFKLHIDENL
jgi:hypothetical protein